MEISTIPPISRSRSAPLTVRSSPAALIFAIQSRKSWLCKSPAFERHSSLLGGRAPQAAPSDRAEIGSLPAARSMPDSADDDLRIATDPKRANSQHRFARGDPEDDYEAAAVRLSRSEDSWPRPSACSARLDNAKLLAGGQSLMPMLNFRFVLPDHVIDLNRVDGLAYIRETADGSRSAR